MNLLSCLTTQIKQINYPQSRLFDTKLAARTSPVWHYQQQLVLEKQFSIKAKRNTQLQPSSVNANIINRHKLAEN